MLDLLSNLNNNRQASIPKIRQNSLAVNQQATNHVDRSWMGEAVRQIFPIKRKSNPTDTRRINSQPDIETNRNFLYPATTYYSRPAHSRSRTKRRIIPDYYYIGKFTNWNNTNTVNNNLNSNSNITKLNRFISSIYIVGDSAYIFIYRFLIVRKNRVIRFVNKQRTDENILQLFSLFLMGHGHPTWTNYTLNYQHNQLTTTSSRY